MSVFFFTLPTGIHGVETRREKFDSVRFPVYNVKWYGSAEQEMLKHLNEFLDGGVERWETMPGREKEQWLNIATDMVQQEFVDRLYDRLEHRFDKFASRHPGLLGETYGRHRQRGRQRDIGFAHAGRSGGWLLLTGLPDVADWGFLPENGAQGTRALALLIGLYNTVYRVVKSELDDIGYLIAFNIAHNTDFGREKMVEMSDVIHQRMLSVLEEFKVTDEDNDRLKEIAASIAREHAAR